MKYKIFILLLLGFIYSGCNEKHSNDEHEHDAESNHESEHAEPKVLLTAYNEKLELFAEADPFIIGKESKILSHFTTLADYKPLDTLSVTIKLKSNNQTGQTIKQPQRRGIYSFAITPGVKGNTTLIYEVNLPEGKSIIEIPITVFNNEEEADKAAEELEISNPNAITFTKEKSWKIDFATEQVKKEKFGQVIQTTGQLVPSQTDEIVLTAKTSGIIKMKSDLPEGKDVASGELLLNIIASGMVRNNSAVEYTEAKNNYENAKAVYDRQVELAKDKIVSERELLNSKREYENYRAIFNNLNQNFSASGQSILSPSNGFISKIYRKNGEYVEAGQPVVSIIKNNNLLIKADIQSRFAKQIKNIYSATVRSDNNLYTLEELNGKILSIGQSLSSDNFSIPITIEIENNGYFMPGEFVKLFLKTGGSDGSLTIPTGALLEEQGLFFVFVQLTPELFEKKEVNIGASDGIKTEIIGGLTDTDRIITKGAMLVKLSQSSGALDPHAGHVH